MQHLTRYRLARAADYLRTTDAGVGEIARLTRQRARNGKVSVFSR